MAGRLGAGRRNTNRGKKGCQWEAPTETSSGGSSASTRTGQRVMSRLKWTITKTKTAPRCGRCRHEPGWYGWLAGWLAGSLAEVENFGSATAQARRDGNFDNGPCSPGCLDYIRAAPAGVPSSPNAIQFIYSPIHLSASFRSSRRKCQSTRTKNGEDCFSLFELVCVL